ncbi:MAG: hypothetical protein KGZ58_08850 [Ignavibacteriales bacterium]|nr:hypothetical protein [Ignavibacteriales bacterium]
MNIFVNQFEERVATPMKVKPLIYCSYIFLAFFLVQCNNKKQVTATKVVQPVERKIKSMSIYERQYFFGKASQKQRELKTVHFDYKGNIIPKQTLPESQQYVSSAYKTEIVAIDSSTKEKRLLRLKNFGNRSISTVPWPGESPIVMGMGNKETEYYSSEDSSATRWQVRYDSAGNKLYEFEYTPDGSVRTKVFYRYNERGNVIDQHVFNQNGSHRMMFDDFGNEVRELWYNLVNEPQRELIYVYNYFD